MRLVPPSPDPAPEGLSPLQFAAAMRTNALQGWPQRAYEEEVVQRRLFGRSTILLNAPDAIRHVLVDQHENYARTRATLRILRPLLGDGLFISQGQAWRHQRRILSPAFTPRAVELLVPHILSATREAVVELIASGPEPLDLFGAVQRLALEIAGRTMFSLEMRRHGPALRRQVVRYSERLGRPYLPDMLLPIWMPAPHDFPRAWFRRGWVKLIDSIMAERISRAGEGSPRDLLDLLMEARDPETGEDFTPAQLRDQVATMILAGHETTAVTLCWALYLLALSPQAQDRVAEEVQRSRSEEGAPAQIQELTYTRAVLDETLRLYPPAFVIVRAARQPDHVAGVEVRPGDLTIISPWILHRHRKRWAEPEAFAPERFLPGAAPVDRFAYLPFGTGPRVCIGAHFAVREATLVLAELVRNFRIELASQRPVLPVGIVTTQPDHAPMFRLQRR